ncbi:hypothetical protein WJX73_008411 [Symbiochloris irregularis]|uniref:Uncharacterized protein n=1 Tax=Symbiochloris irregularis TaxID=706552 RepID=A0AAW1PLV6_9CHLO
MVELQGEIASRPGISEADLQVGTLAMSSTSKGVIELTIGYHQLAGKLVPLKKPLAVLEKVPAKRAGDTSHLAYQVRRASGSTASSDWGSRCN